jgi:hypothetical protein
MWLTLAREAAIDSKKDQWIIDLYDGLEERDFPKIGLLRRAGQGPRHHLVSRLVLCHPHGSVSADITGVGVWEPHVEDLALPKSLRSGNFILAKAVIW